MLVRNLTKSTVKIGYGKDKVALPPMKIVNVDECKFPADYIKKHYGYYVQILIEKQEEKKIDEQVLEKDNEGLEQGGDGEGLSADDKTGEETETSTEDENIADNDNDSNVQNDNTDIGDADSKDGEVTGDADTENETAVGEGAGDEKTEEAAADEGTGNEKAPETAKAKKNNGRKKNK